MRCTLRTIIRDPLDQRSVGVKSVGPDVTHPNTIGDLKIVGPDVTHPNFIYWNKDSTSCPKEL